MSARAAFWTVASLATIVLSHSAVVAFQDTSTTSSTSTTAAASQTTTSPGPQTVWDGVYTDEQAKRGESVYSEKCVNCHGSEMTGGDAPSLVGSEFSANWSDLSLNDLSERIRVTMPADNAGTLTRQQVVDIIALILQHAEMPAGKSEIPPQAEALKQIKYLGIKPQ